MVSPTVDNVIAENWSEDNLIEAIVTWRLSSAEEKQLRAIQARIQDVNHPWNDPHVILGFATAGGYATAEQKFRKMIQWRLDNGVDKLLTEYKPNPLLLDNSCVAFLKDYDKDGDPIYVERGGAMDAKGLLQRFSREDVMKHAIWLREVQCDGAWVQDYKRRQGRMVHNITVVYDLHGLSSRHLHPNVLGFFQQLMQITDDYYPGPIKRMIIIRSPHIFRFAWKTIQHFFSEESRDKMIFTGSDYLSELSKYMDINVLPPCINPNGSGETAIGMPKSMEGGLIPDHVGQGGIGYRPAEGTGISEAPTEDSSLSSTDEGESSSDDEDNLDETVYGSSGDLSAVEVTKDGGIVSSLENLAVTTQAS